MFKTLCLRVFYHTQKKSSQRDLSCNIFTTSCNFLKHSKFIWVVNVTSGKKEEICVLHLAHAKATLAQGEAVALKCLSTWGCFVSLHTTLCLHRETPTREQGLTLNHTVLTFPAGWEGRVSLCYQWVHTWKSCCWQPARTICLSGSCLASHSKSKQGCLAITWLTWKHSKH